MKELLKVVSEALMVVAVGTGLGLTANSLRAKHRIELPRDYFAKVAVPIPGPAGRTTAPADGAGHTPVHAAEKPIEEVVKDLESQGFQVIRHDEVVTLFNDPVYQAGAYIFIDARDDEQFAESHVPLSKHLNPLWTSQELDHTIQVLQPAIQAAHRIVVYCTGGDCTDSVAAMRELINRGVDFHKLFIYPEGFQQWAAASLPVQRGGATQ